MGNIIKGVKEKFNDFVNEGKQELKKIEKPKDLIKQIPNLFTISRLFLVPFITANLLSGNLIGAGLITIGASVTDFLDGKIARKLNAVSNFGANLDVLVDKLFITSVTIPLFVVNPSLIVPVLLDMIIASINGYAHIKEINIQTSKIGKIKTFFLDSLICSAFFYNLNIINHIFKGLYFATVGLQIKTTKEYYETFLTKKREKEKEKKINKKRETPNLTENLNDNKLNSNISLKGKNNSKNNTIKELESLKENIINNQEMDNEITKKRTLP